MRYNNTFLKLWWLLPDYLQPRFIRIMYAKYWYDWFVNYNTVTKQFNLEERYKYIKTMTTDKEFLNISKRK